VIRGRRELKGARRLCTGARIKDAGSRSPTSLFLPNDRAPACSSRSPDGAHNECFSGARLRQRARRRF